MMRALKEQQQQQQQKQQQQQQNSILNQSSKLIKEVGRYESHLFIYIGTY